MEKDESGSSEAEVAYENCLGCTFVWLGWLTDAPSCVIFTQTRRGNKWNAWMDRQIDGLDSCHSTNFGYFEMFFNYGTLWIFLHIHGYACYQIVKTAGEYEAQLLTVSMELNLLGAVFISIY